MGVPIGFEQRSRWRAFRDPSVEAEYRAWHRERILPIVRLIASGVACIYALTPLSYLIVVGQPPLNLLVACYGISIPTCLAVLVSSFTGLQRWANGIFTAGNVVLALTLIWVANDTFAPASGAVACALLLSIFYPIILRVRTGTATLAALILATASIAIIVQSQRRGEIPIATTWYYVAAILTAPILVVVASTLIEAGMRRQFAADQTIARQQKLLRKYAPAAVAERIVSGDDHTVGQPQRLRVTAMSSDVAGFTALADQIDPESLSQIINEYMAAMSDVVEGHGGVVTEFAGDGLTAIFGAPEAFEPEEQVGRALSAAEAMHARLAELNKTWFRLGIEQPLRVRIGINTGMLSVGTFGSDGRATYTAIGLQMNVAARIQAQCEPGQTLLSSASRHLVSESVACEPLGEITVKGVHFPISIYAPGQP